MQNELTTEQHLFLTNWVTDEVFSSCDTAEIRHLQLIPVSASEVDAYVVWSGRDVELMYTIIEFENDEDEGIDCFKIVNIQYWGQPFVTFMPDNYDLKECWGDYYSGSVNK